LKALDYSRALAADDIPEALARANNEYLHERDLLRRCEEQRLSRIVRALGDGRARVDGVEGIPTVDYLIFELADDDIRGFIDEPANAATASWGLRVLHQVAVGLNQLHTHRMAHQDLKPSNVLVFDPTLLKIGDLGRASYRGGSPFDEHGVAGDLSYAPLELLYGDRPSDWNARCQACDMYLLGSLALFLYTRVSMTAAVLSKLDRDLRPKFWGAPYNEVLPFVRDAFSDVLETFAAGLPEALREPLVRHVRELCDPDPSMRGHPRAIAGTGSSYSLVRHIAAFDLLAQRAEMDGLDVPIGPI
jgi:serine/threonine protein kinase